jgi:hypothetical protein
MTRPFRGPRPLEAPTFLHLSLRSKAAALTRRVTSRRVGRGNTGAPSGPVTIQSGASSPTTGEFQIAYDGGPWSPPIDTHAPAPRVRQVLDTHTFTGAASAHTVKLRVVGTSGRPDVAVDAFAYTN